jgi:hypothetical protein
LLGLRRLRLVALRPRGARRAPHDAAETPSAARAIADSTASRHGVSDSRAAAKTTGIGRRTIVLAVDAGGAPTAFRWSTHTKRAHATSIALGRIAS